MATSVHYQCPKCGRGCLSNDYAVERFIREHRCPRRRKQGKRRKPKVARWNLSKTPATG